MVLTHPQVLPPQVLPSNPHTTHLLLGIDPELVPVGVVQGQPMDGHLPATVDWVGAI